MIRRRTVVALSGAVLLGTGLLLVVAFAVAVTQTRFGHGKIRAVILAELARTVHGQVYIGHLSGNLVTTVSVDSVEIRDPDGLLFLATGRLTASYDPRDLFARKIALRNVEVEHPVVHLIRHRNGIWNLRRLFPPAPPSILPLQRLPKLRQLPPRVRQLPGEAARGFGDYIVFDTLTIHDGSISYSMPWDPDDTLRRARRDSAIGAAMADPRQGVTQWPEGLVRTLRWTGVQFASPHVRIVDPDSVGVGFAITRFDADESDPPFQYRSVQGHVRIVGDSAFLDLPHVELPGSQARGGGKLWWGDNQPLSTTLHFVVDSVSLADIAWVYPTLPHTGGGHGVFDMRSDRTNPHIASYALTGLDIRTTESHIRGALTFVVGHPALGIRDVALQADPLDFAFIRVLSGAPFPVDWAGQLTGFARGPGGPVPHFRLDTTDLVFRDAHVQDAVSRAAGSGELDITEPSRTTFHHFHLTLHRLDLRTPEFVLPNFARLHGTVSGTATLDSLWNDITLSNADVSHYDGGPDDDATRLVGSGHVNFADTAARYDVDVRADPVAFSTLARSYPNLWLRGSMAGPIAMHGPLTNVDVAATLSGDAGTLHVEGNANTLGPAYRARGTIVLTDADLRGLSGRASAPPGSLNGRVTVDVEGDSIGDLTGVLRAEVDRSVVDRMRIFSGLTKLRLGDGHMAVDTLQADWALGTLRASGGLGLVPTVRDSVQLSASVDSLGGLRPYIASDSTQHDSLSGSLRLAATVSGSLDTVRVVGTAVGSDVWIGSLRARSLGATFAVDRATTDPLGTSAVTLDGLSLLRIALDHIGVDVQFVGGGRTLVAVSAVALPAVSGSGTASAGVRAAAALTVARTPGATAVAVDTFALHTATNVWHLSQRPARIQIDSAGTRIDPFTLRGSESGWVAVRGMVPVAGSSLVHIVADSIPLADLGAVAESPTPLGGLAALDWLTTGPRADPVMRITGALVHPAFGDVRLDGIPLRGDYKARRLDLEADLVQHTDTTLRVTLSLPIDLALMPLPERLIDTGALRGNIRADSTQFGALATLYPTLQNPRGTLVANVDIGGTERHPTLTGDIRVANAEAGVPALGVRLSEITANLGLIGDSLAIRTLSASTLSPDRRNAGDAALTGWLTFADLADPHFGVTLRASNFHLLHRPRLADVEVSTTVPLRLVGQESRSHLTGAVRVDRGTIYLPDILQKQVINLEDPEVFSVLDTSVIENQRLLPVTPPRIVQGLRVDSVQVTLAQDVWLKSSEATINLSTAEEPLLVTTAPTGVGSTRALALAGTLIATRGDYRLNLGLVQRTFLVDQPGTVRFTGEPIFDPALGITAVYTVRQPQTITGDVKPDVRVRVTLGGTLEHPTVALSSADSVLQYSQSDLLSYLVTGHPSYDVTSGGNAGVLTSVVLPTLGTALGSQLSGGLFDYVQVQPGGYSQIGPQAGTAQGTLFNTLSGTRIGAGKQIGPRTFLSADLGVCQLGALSGSTGAGASPGFADEIGIRVEHQLTTHISIAGESEPGTNALYCTTAYSRSFVTTPRQWGLDFFHTWQF